MTCRLLRRFHLWGLNWQGGHCRSFHRLLAARASEVSGGFHQERISTDGSLKVRWPEAGTSSKPEEEASNFSGIRPPVVPVTAPAAPPIGKDQLEKLVDLLTSCKNVLLLSGAGVSTESGTPDYRGQNGAYTTGYKPMTHQQFMGKEGSRVRYWARNYAGWKEFSTRTPNSGHQGIAQLQRNGWLGHIITQNVDHLHQAAGSSKVLELHGTTHNVVCTDCGNLTPRFDFQSVLSGLNPVAHQIMYEQSPEAQRKWRSTLRERRADDPPASVRPDGDVELYGAEKDFVVPSCEYCGGLLKPDVVFFGDSVPPERATRAMELAQAADGVLVMGSSVMVYSAFRLVKAAKENGAKLAIVNVGETRVDSLADIKVEALVGEVAALLSSHVSLLTPRPPVA
ncbi:hypothetical protein BSKO_10974 [Bryopsis sp. KO-2023]|nr:hypothetical protein BSKO_10974 [Bryopsis sp. KO-2023]